MFPKSLTYQNNKSFFLFGPRGVGKTNWLRRRFPNDLYFDLLEARTYSQLLADPGRLQERIPQSYEGWVILDEVQRIPELLNEVHRLIESRKLCFIMTGSSARALRRKGVNRCCGRYQSTTPSRIIRAIPGRAISPSFTVFDHRTDREPSHCSIFLR